MCQQVHLSHPNHQAEVISPDMSSRPGGNLPTHPINVSLASLADAADALAKAAAMLAIAAQATSDAISGEIQRPESPEESHGINLGRGSDIASDIAFGDNGDPSQEQGIHIGDSDHEGEQFIPDTISEEIGPRPMNNNTTGENPGHSSQIKLSYRLLVDSDADVLFACALIDKRHKVVCYMSCGMPLLRMYRQLIENVTESPVYILERNEGHADFIESQGSVLLVPETLVPQFKIEGEHTWVIHIGWPVSETLYDAQRRIHQARNNILVAFHGDKSLYPSGDKIINMTQPWPNDGPSFRASVSILRPLYEAMLSEISLEMKSQAYMDWIQFHGIHGPRHVKAWTPSLVVQHANEYLLKVLQWSGGHAGGDVSLLPGVTAGFVTQNGLQSAVQEGILRVGNEDSDSPGPLPSPAPRLDSVHRPTEFQPTIGQTYFTLDEQFDAVPLMCFISDQYSKVICFLGGQGILQSYQQLLSKITGRLAISPEIPNNSQAIEEATTFFLSVTQPAILLLAYNTPNLPSALSNRLYSVGAIPRSSLSAEHAAHQANRYAAEVLLHGDASDGRAAFPPIAERPPVSKKIVEKFGLQPAVDAGLLTIG
ncbi:hypothetical protein FRC11_006545 [Ceratobasidium sp. 423]|nr:hypothetical protein FRC11_006545 [Ceratobasidium sp. 423]